MPRYIIRVPHSKALASMLINTSSTPIPAFAVEIMEQYGATWMITLTNGSHWAIDCPEETLMMIVMKTGFTWEEELWHKQ